MVISFRKRCRNHSEAVNMKSVDFSFWIEKIFIVGAATVTLLGNNDSTVSVNVNGAKKNFLS